MNWERRLPLVLGGLLAIVVASTVGFAVFAATTLPDGPVDVIWDKAACSHCSMHLGEPQFAAQLTTTGGRTHFFDDPGCLFGYVAAAKPEVHATWFRHLREPRWLPESAVAFAVVEQSPMGFGIGAVDPGTPGALSLAAARERCLRGAEQGAGAHGEAGR